MRLVDTMNEQIASRSLVPFKGILLIKIITYLKVIKRIDLKSSPQEEKKSVTVYGDRC